MPRTVPQHHHRETARSAARTTRISRRRQLLALAVQVFAERGYHGTTLEMVAEAAGVSEAVLAKYFEDKAVLFRGALEEVRAATLADWQTEAAELPDPLARLHAVAEMYLRGMASDSPAFRVLYRALVDCDGDEIAEPLRSFFLDCETFLAGLLAEGQQAGVFRRSLDPRVGARQLLHAGVGQAATRRVMPVPDAETDSLAKTIECLLHGLLKTDV